MRPRPTQPRRLPPDYGPDFSRGCRPDHSTGIKTDRRGTQGGAYPINPKRMLLRASLVESVAHPSLSLRTKWCLYHFGIYLDEDGPDGRCRSNRITLALETPTSASGRRPPTASSSRERDSLLMSSLSPCSRVARSLGLDIQATSPALLFRPALLAARLVLAPNSFSLVTLGNLRMERGRSAPRQFGARLRVSRRALGCLFMMRRLDQRPRRICSCRKDAIR